MTDKDLVVMDKGPWLTKREWFAGLVLPYLIYELARWGMGKSTSTGHHKGAMRRMWFVQMVVYTTMELLMGIGSGGMAWMFWINFVMATGAIFLIPSDRLALNGMTKEQRDQKQALTDGDG